MRRLALNLTHHLKRHGEAAMVCIDALADPYVRCVLATRQAIPVVSTDLCTHRSGRRLSLERRLMRLATRKGSGVVLPPGLVMQTLLQPPVTEINGMC